MRSRGCGAVACTRCLHLALQLNQREQPAEPAAKGSAEPLRTALEKQRGETKWQARQCKIEREGQRSNGSFGGRAEEAQLVTERASKCRAQGGKRKTVRLHTPVRKSGTHHRREHRPATCRSAAGDRQQGTLRGPRPAGQMTRGNILDKRTRENRLDGYALINERNTVMGKGKLAGATVQSGAPHGNARVVVNEMKKTSVIQIPGVRWRGQGGRGAENRERWLRGCRRGMSQANKSLRPEHAPLAQGGIVCSYY